MLTTFKVSSLACKCAFYRTKQNSKGGLNLEGLEMQKWNIPTDRLQLKCQKMAHFFLFFDDDSKILVTI